MIGSYNVCYANQINNLRGFKDRINSPKVQRACAGESTVPVAETQSSSRVCVTCATPLTSTDLRRRFCSAQCQRKSFSASLRRRQAEYRERFPQREVARQTLKNAILLGKMRRCTRCEECGEKAFTEGHHDDYAKPLYVTWLCRACHAGLEGGGHFGRGEFKHTPTVSVEAESRPTNSVGGAL